MPTATALFLAPTLALAATVSGTVTYPTSDSGYTLRTITSRVRIEGTGASASVVEDPVNWYTGTFTLTDVPAGPVTLILEEPLASGGVIGDRFTQDSKRIQLNVTGDVGGVAFAPEYHWRNLPSYPPPYHNAAYDIWEPFFVSSDVGFIGFQNRGISPFEFELWRTTDGGETWVEIGHWTSGVSDMYPDLSAVSMMFVDADHGVMRGVGAAGGYRSYGVMRTADGGQTWSYVDVPNAPPAGDQPGGNGLVNPGYFGAIDATHWIMCGAENIGTYMGSGTPGWLTIWETDDAGATWRIANTLREDYPACSALGVDASGQAFLFDTPYAFGGNRYLLQRDVYGAWTVKEGNWSNPEGNDLVTNQGYGPADAPMLDGTAWINGGRWVDHSTSEVGMFRSLDGGLTWFNISAAQLHSFDFANMLRGFATAGGPAYMTYDGGVTWRYQLGGGGVCCHGNYMFAFGPTQAIWKDGGVGDPNGLSDVMRYSEQASPNFEVLPGTGLIDVTVLNGTVNVPMLALEFTSHGLADLQLQPLRLKAYGTGNDKNEVVRASLWWDRNANGVVDAGDTAISSAPFTADNGEVTLSLGGVPELHQMYPRQLLVTYDFSASARNLVTFYVTLRPDQTQAVVADGGATLVTATAPSGTVLQGRIIATEAAVPKPPVIPAQVAPEGSFYSFNVPVFVDPNGDPLTYRFTGLPAWLVVYNPANNPRFLYGKPPYSESTHEGDAAYTIGYEAEDTSGNIGRTTFALTVADVNARPVPPSSIPAKSATEGVSFGYSVPEFYDPESETLTYSYTGLPTWLAVQNAAVNPRYLAGVPPYTESGANDIRSYWITVRASDPHGAYSERTFQLTVLNANGPPLRPDSISATVATEGQYFSYSVPVFPDPDGEVVTYSYSGLPSWLVVYNPAANPRFLYGRPPFTESGPNVNKVYWITVTATDPNGYYSSRAFSLTVLNAD
jgi:photosystem II stability/assembly factor-like uncharacterized protein